MRVLTLHQATLAGINLVEASAGTGKTYTLSGLYLRLLLEVGLSPDQILVVTYTKAATAELKERIRKRLLEAREAIGQGQGTEPEPNPNRDQLVDQLVCSLPDRQRAARQIDLALAGFDQAAIHTIHGFCRRVLVDHAFETSQPFDTELIPDQAERLQQIADDFWRGRIAGLPNGIAGWAVEHFGAPEALLRWVSKGLGKPYLEVRTTPWPQALEALDAELNSGYLELRASWRSDREEIQSLLSDVQVLNQRSYKAAEIPALCHGLEAWLQAQEPPFSPFAKIDKFTRETLAKAVKKGRSAPSHPFFDLASVCHGLYQRRAQAYAQALNALIGEFHDYLRAELPRRQREAGELSYDDLLLQLYDALDSVAGGRLVHTLRNRFPAALVDEFQDTDPIQYGILSRIYGDGSQPLFLVGDPKQAIYSFRGADIFAYLEARRAAGEGYSLDVNWRSTPRLIQALNSLYRGHSRPFYFDSIPYHPVKPSPDAKELLHERGGKSGPLRIWRLPFDESTQVGAVRQAVAEATAGEIARLLKLSAEGGLRIDGTPLGGGDLAVLVRTHAQARQIALALSQVGVNSVRLSQESVFQTQEAEQLERLLMALVEPRREALLRAALATDLLGWDGAQIDLLNRDDHRQSELRETFHVYHRRWREEGFIGMFRQLLQEQGVEQRLLGFRDGERRLTNLYQLAELLQRQDRTGGKGLEGLLKWFSRQRQEEPGSAEERLLRLESDSDLVKIVTLHASKGLEYPLVFCPFAWDEKLEVRGNSYLFHDPEQGNRAVLELGSADFERSKDYCLREELAESLRLLYVALTRARYRVYLPWGKVKGSGGSALAWLLHARDDAAGSTLQQWAGSFKQLGADDINRTLEELVADSRGAISVEDLPTLPRAAQLNLGLEPGLQPARVFSGQPAQGPRVGSFSSLIAGHRVDQPDHDALTETAEAEIEAAPATIHGFPRGPNPGSCLHAIFEDLDFTAGSRPELERLVEQNLTAYGLERRWTRVVADCVTSVLETPLNDEGLRLGVIGNHQRINEMEFHYPLELLDPEALAGLAKRHRFAVSERIMSQFDGLQFASLRGFMKGYIDMVFESGNRFYLVDYKSNWLGEGLGDYAQESLETAMLTHHYPLQYLFYTLALHRYLRQRLAGYDYERHFGGVFYLFLRGMAPAAGHDSGIFRERPPKAFIDALDRMLGTRLET